MDMSDAVPTQGEKSPFPPLGRRYLGSVVDGLVVLAGTLLIGTVLGDVSPSLVPLRVALFVLLWVGYEPGGTAFGVTLGQRLLGYRVRREADPKHRIGLPAAAVRFVVKLALGLLSFITMGFNNRRRALHDLASGSVVLSAEAATTAAESLAPSAV